jgi:hypothetical protein
MQLGWIFPRPRTADLPRLTASPFHNKLVDNKFPDTKLLNSGQSQSPILSAPIRIAHAVQ